MAAGEMPEAEGVAWLGLAEGEGQEVRFLRESLLTQVAAFATAPTDTHAVNALNQIADLVDDLIDEIDEVVWDDGDEDSEDDDGPAD